MNLRKLSGLNLVLAGIIVVFLFSFVVSANNLARHYQSERRENVQILWIASQLERDYLKLLSALERHAERSDGASGEEVTRRVAALHSRLRLFAEGRKGALLSSLPEIRKTIRRLSALMTDLDAELTAFAAGDPAAGPAVIDALTAAEVDTHLAVLSVFVRDEAVATSMTAGFERFAVMSSVSLIGILLSGGALIWLSVVQVRRAQRAERISHRARLEAERARRKAEDASRAKSAFLAQMSHELRTPLNAILGFSEVIQRQVFGPVGDRRYVEYLGYIHASGSHLLSLIDDILDLSRVEAGRYDLQVTRFDPAELIEDTLAFLAEAAQSAGVALRQDTGSEPPQLLADRRALRQILLNLLSNALKYTPRGGEVFVTGRLLPDRRYALSIVDSGIGIESAAIDKVLQPFGRADDPMTRGREGAGLGLSITKQLAELHGGTLAIESRPGAGTEVTVTLPADRVVRRAQAA